MGQMNPLQQEAEWKISLCYLYNKKTHHVKACRKLIIAISIGIIVFLVQKKE